MQKADDENIKARIDPLDLYKRNGDWKKVG